MAAQTLSSSVASATDFLQDEMEVPEFKESDHSTEFLRRIDTALDLLNSRNPFAKGSKAPVTLESLPLQSEQCKDLDNYIFELKDERGNLLQNGRRKTYLRICIQFTFSNICL